MTTKENKALARRFSRDDWMDITRDIRSWDFPSMEPEQAQTVAMTILLERDGLLATSHTDGQ